MAETIVRSRWFIRFTNVIIPVLTWVLITMPVWFSPFHPAVVAYFIIGFDLYFFYKAISTVYLASLSYRRILNTNQVEFSGLLKRCNSRAIYHFVIIPNYKEPLYKLQSTIQAITDNRFGKKQMYLILAFEKREKESEEKYRTLIAQFGRHFRAIIPTYHTLQPGEEPGKASNQTHAAKIIDQYVSDRRINTKKVIITICDADSRLPTNYFAYLTYRFIKDKDRLYHFYCAPVLLYNNFWRLPFFVRIQSTISSILRLAFLSSGDRLIQISTYSTSLMLLKRIGFWDVDVIPEDWHVYFQAFFTFGKRVRTLPLYTIINGDAVYSGKTIKTSINRYEQERRWAWGATDIPYALRKLVTTPQISFLTKIKKILFLSETHLLWTSSFFILTISASIPPLINPLFKKTVLGFILPQLSGLILTLSSSMLLVYVYLDFKLREKIKVQTRPVLLPLMIIQWYFLPVISFFLSSLPALDAHTRMLFGKKITYKVTEKV
ncbi:glycosyltransferase family 2 protein [Patescibacteria group bacterium]|nr:glycosyltransferase family 2 protein [Patescibacteria group bacterium]MCL5091663.1 glycosyltransferase family 2 protein [Patescibacteria group bacterium]